MDQLVTEVVMEAVKHVRQADELPLICHSFSNGGCLPLQRMQMRMMGTTDNENTDAQVWKLIRERYQLGAQVFDSSPAYPDMETFRRAARGAVPNPILASLVFLIAILYHHCCRFYMEIQALLILDFLEAQLQV